MLPMKLEENDSFCLEGQSRRVKMEIDQCVIFTEYTVKVGKVSRILMFADPTTESVSLNGGDSTSRAVHLRDVEH